MTIHHESIHKIIYEPYWNWILPTAIGSCCGLTIGSFAAILATQDWATLQSEALFKITHPTQKIPKTQISALLTRQLGEAQVSGFLAWQAEPKLISFTTPEAYQGSLVYEGKPKEGENLVALTFDDGPYPDTTPQVLDILNHYQIKATFFWVGAVLVNHPEVAKRVVAEGHAVGNHSWNHKYGGMDADEVAREVDRTTQLIFETTGAQTTLFRPPGGYLNNGLVDHASAYKYSIIMWSTTSADTDPNATAPMLVNNVVNGVHSGSIVLMHDGGGDRSTTVQALPTIIEGLKQQGYQFVTVPELLARSAP